ncbi:hypothetical protein HDU97_007971 [Phlyctochytrium planicorne]|nr:hypothetical protein HDU97_007971 [Phlyctochytrium planicorne]
MKFSIATIAVAAVVAISAVQANPTGKVITGPNDPKLPFKSDKWVQTPEGKWSLDGSHIENFKCSICFNEGCYCVGSHCVC